ncbi:MAG TPA: hypothetical protein VK108_08195 [Pseudogracilibacillus sp.]|nr:hypothetical protein [Pseudogracilibacillus sp.]
MITSLKELNKRKLYTLEQLECWKKFQGLYLNVCPNHFTFWKDGKGYITVFEVRGTSEEVRENYLSVDEIA